MMLFPPSWRARPRRGNDGPATRRHTGLAAEVRALEPRTMPSVTIQIDYSYDTANFFDTQAKRDLLRSAADAISAGFSDALSAIVPSGNNTWSLSFPHPGTGLTQTIQNPTIPADTIVVYAGGRSLGIPGIAGQGGTGAYSSSGNQAWLDTVAARGQAGALGQAPTDFAPWGGFLTFETSPTTPWYFGQDPGGLNGGVLDFYTIAAHELGHVLGIGTSASWSTYVSGNTFTGPAATAAHGGSPVPLSADTGHWAQGTLSDGAVPVMVPSLLAGTRRPFTALDFAGLRDVGWAQAAVTNQSPVLGPIGDRAVAEGALLAFTATATDPDLPPNSLTYSLDPGAPAGVAIDPVTGAFSWTPTEAQGPASYPITVRVTDNGTPTRSDSETFNVIVTEDAQVNAAPTLEPIANQTIAELAALSFPVTASDPDGPASALTYSLVNAPAGVGITPNTGIISWTPTEAHGPGVYTFTVRVTDAGLPARSADQPVTITVVEANSPPVLGPIGDRTVSEGALLAFTATTTDPDVPPNSLTYGLDPGAPPGASIDPNTGAFSWTPGEGQGPGSYAITVRVTDSGTPALSDSETFNVTVTEVNTRPVLAGLAPRNVAPGKSLKFTATATDPDAPANALAYSLVGAPAGAVISPSTGAFSWTPTYAQGGRRYVFSVVVRDTGNPALSDARTVAINVLAPPRVVRITRSRGRDGTRAITIVFNQAMNSATVARAGNYAALTSRVAGGRPTVRVGITARYDARNRSVTLTLSRPTRTALQVTIRKAVSAANGVTLGKDTTLRVQ